MAARCGSGHRRRVVFAGRRRAVAPVLQQPRRLLSVTGSTLAWAQRAATSSAAAPGVSLLAAATSAVVAATEGVTASFIKELVRRATLVVLRAGQRPAVLRQAHLDEVLAEMNAEHQSLTPVAARRRRRPRGCTLAGHHPADKQVTAQAVSRHELAEKRRRDPRRPARPRAHMPRADSPDRHAWLARAQPCPRSAERRLRVLFTVPA